MPVDPGVVDAYLTALQGELDRRESELGQLVEQLKTAKLEQVALAALPADIVATLVTASVTGRLDAAGLALKRDQLRTEIQAIRLLKTAAKGAA